VANSRDFVLHVLELAAPAGRVNARAMFGGHGLYVDGTIVGIIDEDLLYLKTDAGTRAAFAALGLPPFQYRGRHGAVHVTAYLRAPDEALESPAAMHEWLGRALEAARRSRASKAATPRRLPGAPGTVRSRGRRAS
jgi:DNA transformation protein